MKVVNEEAPVVTNASVGLPNGFTRVYNKIDGSRVDVHTIDALEYVKRLPHLWSLTPVAKEQSVAEDAVIVPEPAKEEIRPVAEVVAEPEPAPIVEEKPVSARSRKLAKFDN